MKCIPNNAPTNVAAIDERDPNAGNASHVYVIQYGGPNDVCRIQFQHGPRGLATSMPGIFDDDLFAILQDRYEGYMDGRFACEESAQVLRLIKEARAMLGLRVVRRIAQGVLGVNEQHKST